MDVASCLYSNQKHNPQQMYKMSIYHHVLLPTVITSEQKKCTDKYRALALIQRELRKTALPITNEQKNVWIAIFSFTQREIRKLKNEQTYHIEWSGPLWPNRICQ